MFKNYLKIAWRNIVRNRLHSFINVTGLTIGLCACMLVLTVVIDDLSYDSQWSNKDRLFRILTKPSMGGKNDIVAQAPTGLSPALQENFPEIEGVSNIYTNELELQLNKASQEAIKVTSIETDTLIWKLLDFKILSGTPKDFISGRSNLVISESFRQKYFPNEDPVGKIIYHTPSYLNDPLEYLITGVIGDIPSNTHIRADVILIRPHRTEALNQSWHTYSFYYALLKPNTNIDQLTTKVNKWYASIVKQEMTPTFAFQAMEDIYLHSDFAKVQKVQGDYMTIFILCGIALLLLLIACINFVNLTTARTVHRMKEIGVRKIVGAGKRNVVLQFLTESTLIFILATILGVLLYLMSLPYMESFLGHQLTLTLFSGNLLFVIVMLIILTIGILVGLYPALIISGFKPVSALNGVLSSDKAINKNFVLKSLVVLQFSISIAVLIVLIIVQQQIRFMGDRDIGYVKDNLIVIDFVSWNGQGKAFKNELVKLLPVKSASITRWLPGRGPGSMTVMLDDPNNEKNKLSVYIIQGDADLPRTLGLGLKEGRLFDGSFQADKIPWKNSPFSDMENKDSSRVLRSILVTAHTAKMLQITTLNTKLKNMDFSPIGIVEDFNNESLKNVLKPIMIVSEDPSEYAGMLIRVNPGNKKTTLVAIHDLWKEFYPNKVFNVHWVEDLLAKQYTKEINFRKLFLHFSFLSIFLAALGVFGLIEHAIGRRVKEVGIRRVLGASVSSIIVLFSKSFLKLIFFAGLIASPFAWYSADKWLQDFAYKIDIEWWVFAIAASITMVIVIATLIFQTTKAAVVNPVKSLRTE